MSYWITSALAAFVAAKFFVGVIGRTVGISELSGVPQNWKKSSSIWILKIAYTCKKKSCEFEAIFGVFKFENILVFIKKGI